MCLESETVRQMASQKDLTVQHYDSVMTLLVKNVGQMYQVFPL